MKCEESTGLCKEEGMGRRYDYLIVGQGCMARSLPTR